MLENEKKNEILTNLRWFVALSRNQKGVIIGLLGIVCWAISIATSFMIPESRAPLYTKTEDLIHTLGVLSLLVGLFLTHLACLLFRPKGARSNESKIDSDS